ncbi:hypothetical protein Tco_0990290 [Tanacetum coccineum]|uniref:Uncharacterized protein n=1 Tax=Tanacetum coccineum TaxID=301880 RepID=A0ABQ5EVZ9_9ASTR
MAIVVPEIRPRTLELKHGLLKPVQNMQFFWTDKKILMPHRFFNKFTYYDEVPKSRVLRNKFGCAKVSLSTTTPGISSEVAELKDMVKAVLLDEKNQSPAPILVKGLRIH